MVRSEDEEEEEDEDEEDAAEAEDTNNSGSHINDKCNLKEGDGNVLVNVSHPTADPDIYLPRNIADHIKPHQVCTCRIRNIHGPLYNIGLYS